jgi:hypothetical protein
MSKTDKKKTSEKNISLNPLTFTEAVSDLLKIKPPPKESKPKKPPKKK